MWLKLNCNCVWFGPLAHAAPPPPPQAKLLRPSIDSIDGAAPSTEIEGANWLWGGSFGVEVEAPSSPKIE